MTTNVGDTIATTPAPRPLSARTAPWRKFQSWARPGAWTAYGLGALISVVALALAYALDSRVPQTPAPILFGAIVLASRFGGIGPGLLATAICTLGLNNIFIEQQLGPPAADSATLLHLVVFASVAVFVSTLTERMRRAEAQARDDALRLSILADASRVSSTLLTDQQPSLHGIARQIGEALGDACVISLVSENGDWLDHVAWYHRDPATLQRMEEAFTAKRQPVDEGIAWQALRENRPVVIRTDDPAVMRRLMNGTYATLFVDAPTYSIASFPLKIGRRNIGALSLWRSEPGARFSPADMDLLKELAAQAAMALESARLSAYYRALFSSAPEPTVVLDTDHRILDANPAAMRLLRTSLGRARGQSIEHVAVNGADDLDHAFAGMRSQGRWHGEMDVRRSDGKTVPVEAAAVTVHLFTGPVSVWTWHDLTEQRSLQQVRDDFVASTSHELRTPLTAAIAALGLLQQPESGELGASQRDLVENARRNVLRLRILVNDLLAEGQLRANVVQLNRHRFDLRQVITGSVESVYPLLQRKGQRVALDIPEPLVMEGDANRLEQVFVNLLANANLHTPKGSTIAISGRARDGSIRVSVRDDGPGIPEKDVDRIFDRFSRGDTTASGHGLGLAIARSFITMHEGEIHAESLPGQGTTFYLTLPALST